MFQIVSHVCSRFQKHIALYLRRLVRFFLSEGGSMKSHLPTRTREVEGFGEDERCRLQGFSRGGNKEGKSYHSQKEHRATTRVAGLLLSTD